MFRSRLAVLLLTSLLLAIAAAPVHAQIAPKAYAPENLRQLSVPDRIRVIEKEYADQSRNRQIPDDQLEFYLDQINSGWRFSQIKQDIAESLRGTTWQPPGNTWQAKEVVCSSHPNRRTECRLPFAGPAVLSQQISAQACIEGRTWGQRSGIVWVDKGCRARFREDQRWNGGHHPGGQIGKSVVCESLQGKLRRCRTDFSQHVELVEQFSNAACIRGRTWDARPGEIWVSNSCRARFIERRSPGLPGTGSPGFGHEYSVTCTSTPQRAATCNWHGNRRPYLIEQISRAACVENRTWGYNGHAIWVDKGCAARFGVRR